MNEHSLYMQRCFQLARLGEGFVSPNPMVGAVLVHEDRIIGEGYHERYGEAHAEVNCLNAVKQEDRSLIPSSTLYVSLEPCVHVGRTSPCTDLIIAGKIPRVVISVKDNYPLVNGKGIQKLRENNVEVITGILENEGKELLKHFLYFNKHKTPYITLKFAQTKDGYMGIAAQEVHITNELSRRYTHQLRAQHQAVLVGKNTVITDDPELTVRYANGKNPVRIILGDSKMIPKRSHVLDKEAETIFIRENVQNAIKKIAEKGIISVLVEGGAYTLKQFILANLWNEAHILTSDKMLSEIITIPENTRLIRSPDIIGIIDKSISLENDLVKILKNPDALPAA